MQMGIAMVGLRELDAALAQLGEAVATRIGKQAIRAGADVLQDAWARGAPFRPGAREKTWTLASGEKRSAYYGHLTENIRVGAVRPKKENAIVFKVTTGDAFWAYMLEFGWTDRSGKQHKQPWASAIYEQMKDGMVSAAADTLRDGIEAERAKIAGRLKAGQRGLSAAAVRSLRQQGRIS
ncbi:HK97-gp10 family putative phage morphogenesis protein [Sphingomonas canadensis]|uniref:HK97-gp10 family putative phage morphogenesis protein n=1 Tax=Sphingomonas canadensis TaxID=1219257 RepID=A0ABW3HAB4_9SPHN|nr:HK97-gp10 family putative phage morphogenesis protein [Sphingomonas canadensis]MCW3837803.1 HK97 gp10 family phage protein [Sphingomonas canadensis]